MYIHDSHVHTKFSFDGESEISDIIESAIARGVNEISLCDHMDIDSVLDGVYPPYEADAICAAVREAKGKYEGKIQINYGVELGQPHSRPKEALALLDAQNFDFVIGSLHNLRFCPDFYFLKLDKMCDEQIDNLIRRTIAETEEIIDFAGISTLAHITYIQRYLALGGKVFDHTVYKDGFERIFKKLIAKNIALEINTSGLRKNSITMPATELALMYKECGGELITLGSDAHNAADVGAGIEETARTLRSLGFKSQCVVRGGRLVQIEL